MFLFCVLHPTPHQPIFVLNPCWAFLIDAVLKYLNASQFLKVGTELDKLIDLAFCPQTVPILELFMQTDVAKNLSIKYIQISSAILFVILQVCV